MTRLNGWKWVWALLLPWPATIAFAQTFTVLADFDGSNGANPYLMALTQGTDGNLYGTTLSGGKWGEGGVFQVTPSGAITFHSIHGKLASEPWAGLLLAGDGNFYGTTAYGGANIAGTIFGLSPGGVVTTLHSFNGSDGDTPTAELIQGTDGNLYGTTEGGSRSYGTVFRVTVSGVFTNLHSFSGPDGLNPYGALVQGIDGNFYGTTLSAGPNTGTVFKITPAGKLTTLYSFGVDGQHPVAGLVKGSDGEFYGTTREGGMGCGNGCGTIFKITSRGRLTTLYRFKGTLDDGAFPWAGLIQATDGNFYGTCIGGGANGLGMIFKITPDGSLTTVYSFSITDGYGAYGRLFQATTGRLYGSLESGGSPSCFNGCGALYSLDIGLDPFVAFVRDSGKVRGTGGILGQGFTGTTSVSLNGTPASFTVVSDTFLKATVPAGANTGFVTVSTPTGTLTSNKPFRVTPQLLSFDPPSGPIGTQVTITGVSLTQTQGVGFGNRVPAQFSVNSDTQVTATVPAGAKTGKIGIETKGGVAISQGTFEVTE